MNVEQTRTNREQTSVSRKVSLLAVICLLAMCTGLLFGCGSGDNGNKVDVTVSIDSSRAAEMGYSDSLFDGTVTIEKGQTVQDALEATGVAFDDSKGYVSSIDGLADGSKEYPASGWLFYVDGEAAMVGPTEYTLEGGEKITWIFTLDFSEEIELD